jgi:hypothetical protein
VAATPILRRRRVVSKAMSKVLGTHKRVQRRKPRPRIPTITINGVRVPLGEPVARPWSAEVRELVTACKRPLYASLRAWNAMIDALPRCVCGRPVAPIKAKYAVPAEDGTWPPMFCSRGCESKTKWKKVQLKAKKAAADKGRLRPGKVIENLIESQALADAIGQD